MTGDIKNTINVDLKYPKVETFENLTDEDILKYIEKHKNFIKKYDENKDYYIGKNTSINSKKKVDENNPDSRISASYSRTMVSITKGYMFRSGYITYSCENKNYEDTLNNIFEINNEPLKTSELGEAQSKYGIGIELLYSERQNNIPESIQKLSNVKQTETELIQNNETIPYFCSVEPQEVILFYSMDMFEKLIGAIRFYIIDEKEKEKIRIYKVEIYYKNKISEYEMIEDFGGKRTLTFLRDYENFFYDIPFAIYKNNSEYNADYEPVKTLIDAYDIMMSDSINEIQRFAFSYLIIKGMILFDETDANDREQVLEKMKNNRVLQFMESGTGAGAEFLTRTIPSEFFDSVRNTLREDIQFHSRIPDFRDKNFQAASGVSLIYSLFDFENLCADKQSQFEVGLRQRLHLINNFLKIKAVETDKVDIKFTRNIPTNLKEKVEIFKQLAETNKIADEDLLAILPKEIIPDIEKALERIKKQKEENMEMFDLDTATVEDEEQNTNNEEEI